MRRLQDYTVVIRPDDNGTFVAYIPAIPGCHAWGRTPEEAGAEIEGVFEMLQEELLKEDRLQEEHGGEGRVLPRAIEDEDLHDLAVVAERRNEKPISLDEMKRMLKEDGLL